MDNGLEIIVLTVLVLGLFPVVFRRKASIQIRSPKLGIRGARMIYTDQREDRKEEGVQYGSVLYSEKYDLRGKPDYIFQTNIRKNLIPVELKSGSVSEEDPVPHEGDLMQLAAYFLMIEDLYHRRPKEGRLIYSNYMFILRNTPKLRRRVKNTLKDMRDMLKTGEQSVDPSYVKCRYCVCRGTVCEYCQEARE